jgi:hypothetical protein
VGWIDYRHLPQVMHHAGPLPHLAEDKLNDGSFMRFARGAVGFTLVTAAIVVILLITLWGYLF